MAIVINGNGIDMGGNPVSNIVNGDNNDAVNKDYAIGKVASTDNAVVRFNGTAGDVQNSGVIIDDNGNVGVGIAPSAKLHIGDGSDNSASVKYTELLVTPNDITWSNSGASIRTGRSWLNISWLEFMVSNGSSRYSAMTLGANGNLLVGTSVDNGVDKLQVNGSISSGQIPQITTGDLNNYKTRTQVLGTYPSSYVSNLPINDHGYLEVIVYSPNAYVMQRFTTLGAVGAPGRIFVRCLVNGVWSAWVEK